MTLTRAWILVGLQFLIVSVIGFRIIGAPLLGEDFLKATPPNFLFAGTLGLISCLGLVWFGSVKQPKRTWREAGWHTDNLLVNIALGLAGTAFCVAFTYVVLRIVGMPHEEFVTGIVSPNLTERALYTLIGIQAAFGEETLFRGNLQGELAKRMKLPWAILITAVVFAVYHLSRPLGLLNKTFLSITYSALRWKTGSLVAPAVTHGMYWVVMGMM